MSIIPGQGNTSYTSVSALDKILAELKKLRTVISSGTAGDATAGNQVLEIALLTTIDAATNTLAGLDTDFGNGGANTLRVVLEDGQDGALAIASSTLLGRSTDVGMPSSNTLRVVLEDQSRNNLLYQNYDVWDKIPGNSKVFTWVAGTITPFIVDTIEYYTGSGTTLVVTQTFTYDANDNVTSITAS